jgi:hypothetical protein
MRALLQYKNDLIHEKEWSQLMGLESHYDDFEKAGGTKWQDIFLMAKAIKTYSGLDASIEVVIKICCILMVNSFTLTNSMYDPIGIALHPLAALMNHRCEPNAYVRFDTLDCSHLDEDDLYGAPEVLRGSISVHALRTLRKGEEIRISYIDTTVDVERRQAKLSSRYFFQCGCDKCLTELNGPRPTELSSRAVSDAVEILNSSATKPGALLQHLPLLRQALRDLTRAGRSIAEYPSLQLRHELVLALIAAEQYWEAMVQNMILTYQLEPVVYEQWFHPLRLVSTWRLFRLIQLALPHASTEEQRMRLSVLGCSLLQEMVHRTSFIWGPNSQMAELKEAKEGKQSDGLGERTVQDAFYHPDLYGADNSWGQLEYAMKTALDDLIDGPGATLWAAFCEDSTGETVSNAFEWSTAIMARALEEETGVSVSQNRQGNDSVRMKRSMPPAEPSYASHVVGHPVAVLAEHRLAARRSRRPMSNASSTS